jgi:hypothetical protein
MSALQDRTSGGAGDVADHDRQLDPGVLEHLLQALGLTQSFAGDRCSGAGQVPQLSDRFVGNETRPQQPVRAELGQPRRIRDVGLAAGDVLGVVGVDEHHLERAVLQHVVERLPVG